MQNFGKLFKDSAAELKKTRSLAISAMLLALACVLGFFSVQVTPTMKIGVSFIPNELVGFLFGPVVGPIFGAVGDIVKYFLKPTGPFFPGFTISAIVGGLIYGCILYKRPLNLFRVFCANAIVTVFVNMLMNTYWLQLLYGKAFLAIFPARVVKELILLPINVALFFIVAKILERAKLFQMAQRA